MDTNAIDLAVPVFAQTPAVKLAYFFGSRATGESGPLADYDFAVYLEGLAADEMFACELEIASELT